MKSRASQAPPLPGGATRCQAANRRLTSLCPCNTGSTHANQSMIAKWSLFSLAGGRFPRSKVLPGEAVSLVPARLREGQLPKQSAVVCVGRLTTLGAQCLHFDYFVQTAQLRVVECPQGAGCLLPQLDGMNFGANKTLHRETSGFQHAANNMFPPLMQRHHQQ
ncbi:hypothetical protein CCHOA_05490 [Corynebacterium choanae]|uniref:Uncharacterized protein n=1 Tax=Corynebacterium choanae TaxID=1862358 RepID=A0A3G6J6D5_9CORY|nr:hypothetical protein CCHOA_05490 [Corynebacterium choanae]